MALKAGISHALALAIIEDRIWQWHQRGVHGGLGVADHNGHGVMQALMKMALKQAIMTARRNGKW